MDRSPRTPLGTRRRFATIVVGLVVAALTAATAIIAGPTDSAHADDAGAILPISKTAQLLSSGLHHSCLIVVSGELTCWGAGAHGALGYANTNNIGDNETPAQNPVNGGVVQLPFGERAVDVAAGNANTCVLLESGRITCFGDGSSGALGYGNHDDIGDNETPAQNPVNGGIVALPGGQRATSITAGNGFYCALLASRDVTCWGSGSSGELGYGNTNSIGDDETPAQNPVNGGLVPMPGGHKVLQVDAGSGSVCAVLDTRQVTCWGYGTDGRLGYGNTNTIGDNETPAQNPVNGGIVALPGGELADAVSVGGTNACAVVVDGRISCWGNGGAGQLGYGNTNSIGDNETPAQNPVNGGFVPLPEFAVVDQVSVGTFQSCAVLRLTHDVTCWGLGALGELGYGNTNSIGDNEAPNQNPVNNGLVPGGRAETVSAGGLFTCELEAIVQCWGSSPQGQLGEGDTNTIGDNETPSQNAKGTFMTADYGANAESVALPPARLLDTRSGYPTIDGLAAGQGAFDGGQDNILAVRGRGGLPRVLSSVTLAVSVTGGARAGYLTVHFCGKPLPTSANLNWSAGETISNTALVDVDSLGEVCIYTSTTVDVIVDVTAYQSPSNQLWTVDTGRMLDTRPGSTTIDGKFQGGGTLAAGHELELPINGRLSVNGAAAVQVNVAVDRPAADGFLTLYPCGTPRPNAANLTYRAGQTISNAAFVGVGAHGAVCIFSYATTDVVVDLEAELEWTGPSLLIEAQQPARLLDTRAGYQTVDGIGQASGLVGAGGAVTVPVAGRGGTPFAAHTVFVNLSVVDPQGPGYVTAYPCGHDRPTAANLTYAAHETISVSAEVAVGDGGAVCLYTYAAAHLVVDVDGAVV